MKKQLVTIILSILFIGTYCQQITFNRIYIPDSIYNMESVGHSVINKDHNFIIQAIGLSIPKTSDKLMFLKLDSLGNITKKTSITKDSIFYPSGYGSLIKTHDNGYCYAGEMYAPILFYHNLYLKYL